MNTENLIYTLSQMNNDIINYNNISLEDIKNLLLIIYNEFILDNSNNQIIKNYIAIILYNFIELENKQSKVQQINLFNKDNLMQLLNCKLPLELINF